MNPSATSTNPLAHPWADQQVDEPQARERVARVFDTVRVSRSTFSSVIYMGSQARKEFTKDRNVRDEDKPQKYTRDGMPLWSVQVAAVNWRGKSDLLTITVPMSVDPAEKFATGTPVALDGLVFGVTAKRDGGGFVTWCSADDVVAAKG